MHIIYKFSGVEVEKMDVDISGFWYRPISRYMRR